jgi:hypothetical protein
VGRGGGVPRAGRLRAPGRRVPGQAVPAVRSPGAGFGDLYPYGAGLWPYFLEAWAGDGITAAAWARCEDTGSDPPFLTAIDAELAARGQALTDAWIEFTRWNARTGSFADGTGYPDAGRLAAALRETPIVAPGQATVIVEGFSARYLPITGVGESSRIEVTAQRPVAIDVRVIHGDATITRVGDDVAALTHTIDVAPTGEPVDLEVIVTSAVRGGIQQETTVAIAPYTPPPPDDAGGCGCAAGTSPSRVDLAGGGLALIALGRRRRRR